jgi:hypothetical protein
MLYKWLLKEAKSCAVAPSKTTTTWKKWILPRDYDEKLAVYDQGLRGAPTLACHVL